MLGSRRACILSCAIVFSGEISVKVEEVPELYSDPDPAASQTQEGDRRRRPQPARHGLSCARPPNDYQELGADYYDRRHTERVARRAIQTLEQQGYRVTLERVA